MAQYGMPEYWQQRYESDQEPFDWYQRWTGLQHVIAPHLSADHSILVVGCGTSRLSEELFRDGFKQLVNIDVASNAIKIMTDRFINTELESMQFKVMDVMNMSEFQDKVFDIVLDKATLDSILCGENAAQNVPKLTAEVSRVLKDGGKYITISYGEPQYRTRYLEDASLGWAVSVSKVDKPPLPMVTPGDYEKDNSHYIYICTKRSAGILAPDNVSFS